MAQIIAANAMFTRVFIRYPRASNAKTQNAAMTVFSSNTFIMPGKPPSAEDNVIVAARSTFVTSDEFADRST
jgi:hypothetical protein